MSVTCSQVLLHIIIGTKNRQPLILPSFENNLHKYIAAVISSMGHKPIIVNGTADHVHFLLSHRPSRSIRELVKIIRRESALFVNNEGFTEQKFRWQDEFSVYSISKRELKSTIKYITDQEKLHEKLTYVEESLKLIKKYRLEYDFKPITKIFP